MFREAAIQALTKRLQGSLTAMNATAASEVDGAMETQAKLAQRGEALEGAVAAMQVETYHANACLMVRTPSSDS